MKHAHVMAVFLLASLGAIPCGAETTTGIQSPGKFTDTLQKAKQTGHIALGYRLSSPPFSSGWPPGGPVGYSIDLCRALVIAIGKSVGRELAVDWVPVTSKNRIAAVTDWKIDLECGSTSVNAQGSEKVAFMPLAVVSHTRLLVRKNSRIKSVHDLRDKIVAVTEGTTNEQVMLDKTDELGLKPIVRSDDHAQSFAKLSDGDADALAGDDVLINGLLPQKEAQADYVLLDDFVSPGPGYPYGIMYRKDDPLLAKVINDIYKALEREGEIERLERRWLRIPMSPERQTIVTLLAEDDRLLSAALDGRRFKFIWCIGLLAIALALASVVLHRVSSIRISRLSRKGSGS